jgi:phosphate-selective porin OprO/OprP
MKAFVSGLTILLVIGFVFVTPRSVWGADIDDMEKRLQALEQEVADLKQQLELAKEENTKKVQDAPIVTASSKDGFMIKAPDESYKLKIRGLIQADGRFFVQGKRSGYTNTFLMRRVRPIFEGTVARDFDFYLVPDFAVGNVSPQLVDAFLEYKHFPQAKFKAGKFKEPVGLERLQNDAFSNFNEAGLPSNLVGNRDVGVQLSGDVIHEKVYYSIAGFDGTPDAGSVDTDNNNDKDVAGRIFVQPFKGTDHFLSGLGAGVGGSYGHKEDGSIPTYKSTGQVNIFTYNTTGVTADGPHVRFSPQFYFYRHALGLLGEYVSSQQQFARTAGSALLKDKFRNYAWQLSGTYVLTGENASYKGVTPRVDFNPKEGKWGAFEVAARYERLNIDEDVFTQGFASLSSQISEAVAWGTGLNWYLSKNIRVSLDFERTEFNDGAVDDDRKAENAILSRFQLSY